MHRGERWRDVCFGVGAGCAVVVGIYLLLCFAIVQAGPVVMCDAPGPPDDPSAEVVGTLTWRWLPPAAECAWAVDGHGDAIGPPTDGAPTMTHRFGGVIGTWGMAGLVVVAVVSLTAAYVPGKPRSDAAPTEQAVGA